MILIDGNYFARKFFHSCYSKNEKLEESLVYFRHLFFFNLLLVKQKFASTYGDIIIAKDYSSWRKDVLASYKNKRVEKNKEDHILEFYKVYEEMTSFFKDYTNTKVISVKNVEADDVIYTLSKLPGKHLVYSSDKDLVQCLDDNVDVYDFNNKRFIEKSKEVVLKYKLEHILSGDNADNIPNVGYNAEYSKPFEKWMKKRHNIDMSIKIHFKMIKENSVLYEEFTNETKLKAFKSKRMGEKTAKEIVDSNSLKVLLLSNPVINRNFKINQFLIDLDFIPEPIKEAILFEYKNYPIKYPNFKMIYKYLDSHELHNIKTKVSLLIN